MKIDLLDNQEPIIAIPWDVYMDIQAIVDSRKNEIGWVGEAYRDEHDPNVYVIERVLLPMQDANGSTTEINSEGLLELAMDEEIAFDTDKFRYWGHSHGSMNHTNPSGQDEKQMKDFAESCDWFIGTIHDSINGLFGYMVDKKKGLYYENIAVIILEPEEIQIYDSEIAKLKMERDTRKREYLQEYEEQMPDWSRIANQKVSYKSTYTKGNYKYNNSMRHYYGGNSSSGGGNDSGSNSIKDGKATPGGNVYKEENGVMYQWSYAEKQFIPKSEWDRKYGAGVVTNANVADKNKSKKKRKLNR